MSSSKTEQPTRKRLQDAARRGQSFKARDLVIACLTLCGIGYVLSFASIVELIEAYRQYVAGGFTHEMASYSAAVLWLGLKSLLPVLLVCVTTSVLPSWLISGFVLATEALKLDFSILNPVNGFKKLFSLRTVKEFVKASLYLGSFVVAVIMVWRVNRQLLFSQLNGSVAMLIKVWRELLLSLVLTSLGCIVLILLLDALAEYFLFIRDQKMNRQEIKQEMKEQDGNPEVRARRKEIHMEILSEQDKSDVENSRVVIANPTHIAVGIYFRPEITPIPFVSLLETNQRALAVRSHAAKAGVPVIRAAQLARRIYRSHRRYSFIRLDELDEVLRLLVWLDQVEHAAADHPHERPPSG
ncbi:EscU/YscU/HrcU family type III secretion system export apparatus switch protein [Burkholderia ubonensis]|uniref:EscU/YscU/HrcU family type III secretion system export apparatus switch protein n=1 Tax=Burkholderia ubonensis TaxID=101571 RepID=UPI0007555966|nr:EscU/YscU/HrcU family type III secretion system export apparatus switch protein [Burkholderia ubonensis]KVN41171.1 type III secretion system protein SpaS [Burkholderia ubonensis]